LKCDICGKGPQFGHNVSHSNRHTKRKWQPNTQAATLAINGEKKKLNICTRCMRTHNKANN